MHGQGNIGARLMAEARRLGGPEAVRPCTYAAQIDGSTGPRLGVQATPGEGPFVATSLFFGTDGVVTTSLDYPRLYAGARELTRGGVGCDPTIFSTLELFGDGMPAPFFLGDSEVFFVESAIVSTVWVTGFHCDPEIWQALRAAWRELAIVGVLLRGAISVGVDVQTPIAVRIAYWTSGETVLLRTHTYGGQEVYRDPDNVAAATGSQFALGLYTALYQDRMMRRDEAVTVQQRTAIGAKIPSLTLLGVEG